MRVTKKTVESRPSSKKLSTSISAKGKLEYEQDFSKWADKQAKILRSGEFSKLDLENLIEEIESLGRSEKRTLRSYLEVLLMHKLKVKFQPDRHTTSWDLSIKEATYKVETTLHENPSLKPKLKDIIKEAYFSARLKAALETGLEEKIFPEKCPWSAKSLFSCIEEKYC